MRARKQGMISGDDMLKTIRHLDYAVLLCDDLAPMRQFYHDMMGFPIYRDWGNWIEMRAGSMLLTLRERGQPYDGPSVQPHSVAVQLAFRVTPAEVDTCYAELQAHTVEIIEPPTTKAFGIARCFSRIPQAICWRFMPIAWLQMRGLPNWLMPRPLFDQRLGQGCLYGVLVGTDLAGAMSLTDAYPSGSDGIVLTCRKPGDA
jgi:catechol 2,3-dioxygenase-like lactoylglutathione lyase family enzyme